MLLRYFFQSGFCKKLILKTENKIKIGITELLNAFIMKML